TAGSVDDGKSTLVGRLLHDSRSVLADQLEAVARASSGDAPDLALLTDGLRAEREQGITIDVAHRYFATPRRRFILADTPGHVQYTRNMVTGASTADLAVVLVDARKGVVDQTRRHAAVAALLRVPHLVLAVNKMDLVGHDQDRFAAIVDEFARSAAGPGSADLTAVPVSALHGDNVVTRGDGPLDWYTGPTLLEHLETVPVAAAPAGAPSRFPVQHVIRHGGRRYYAGQLVSGTLRVGDPVVVHPGGRTSTIEALDVLGTPATAVGPGTSLTVRLADELDVARGDLLATGAEPPTVTRQVHADVCHLADRPLTVGSRVLVRHTTRTVRAVVEDLAGRDALHANDLGRITVRTAEPLTVDLYADVRRTGAFLLVDPADGATLTAGMVTPADDAGRS
ncbi:sulfate adenylyltransferase, partial [Streptomyces sp. SID5785]|uniref:sulfate adenylyltransferase subunit 1 n=1 Tax=Streptomyces sp. SID5785 TaxID=2690309 RepID=UPI001360D969